jgi:glyoxalase family protein
MIKQTILFDGRYAPYHLYSRMQKRSPAGSWTFGEGCPHHVALNVPDDEALAEQKGIYDDLGYTDCSEIKDRMDFHSIYCRCPGGILVECAATAAGGFAKDEPFDNLGTKLLLLAPRRNCGDA